MNVTIELGGRRATVSFRSRYRDTNDYEVYRDGKVGRVSETDAGVIRSRSEHFTDDEARLAVEAWRREDAAQFQAWQEQRS